MLVTRGGLPKIHSGLMTYYAGERLTGYGGLLNHVGGHVWLRKRQALEPAFQKNYLRSMVPQMNKVKSQSYYHVFLLAPSQSYYHVFLLAAYRKAKVITCVAR